MEKKGNYNEMDMTKPINEYAKTKIMAEREILKLGNFLIVRVDIMYGFNSLHGKNGVFDKILSGDLIEIRDTSQIRQPVFIDDVVNVIIELLKKNQNGIFHVAGPTRMGIVDFLKGLEKTIRNETKVKVVESNSPPLLKIPKNSTFNISKIRNLGITTQSFEEGLKKLKNQLSLEK